MCADYFSAGIFVLEEKEIILSAAPHNFVFKNYINVLYL